MSTDENKLLVRRFYEEVVSSADVARLEDFISPAFAGVHGNVRRSVGLAGAREHILGVRLCT